LQPAVRSAQWADEYRRRTVHLQEPSAKSPLREATIGLDEGDRVGIIGVNGCGKSTLLKVLAGLEPARHRFGTLARRQNLRTALLEQKPPFDPGHNLIEHCSTPPAPARTRGRSHPRMELAHERHARHPEDAVAAAVTGPAGGADGQPRGVGFEARAQAV
jgi:ATPase subunit of ABC transporter with duplicated ATPase domains